MADLIDKQGYIVGFVKTASRTLDISEDDATGLLCIYCLEKSAEIPWLKDVGNFLSKAYGSDIRNMDWKHHLARLGLGAVGGGLLSGVVGKNPLWGAMLGGGASLAAPIGRGIYEAWNAPGGYFGDFWKKYGAKYKQLNPSQQRGFMKEWQRISQLPTMKGKKWGDILAATKKTLGRIQPYKPLYQQRQ